MQTFNVQVPTRDGENMPGYLVVPDGEARGSVIAISEIWGINEAMHRHAHEFASAGYTCFVPDIFWRQEPGLILDETEQDDVIHALNLYYRFDYNLAVLDMEDAALFLHARDGKKVGVVGYCLGGKLCYLMCCRTDVACAVGYYGTYIEHSIAEASNLHRPFLLHTAGNDHIVPPLIRGFVDHILKPNPLVAIYHYPEAEHAFARFGGAPYKQNDAELALDRTIEFFGQHLSSDDK